MTATTVRSEQLALREKQIKQAEEILASVPEQMGVAKGLFWGKFAADWVFPYPQLSPSQDALARSAVSEVTQFCEQHLNPAKIDRDADIPREVIDGLARLGVLGMTAPVEMGGRGFNQMAYGRVLEVIGGRCSSTAIFVNAHHSIGMRALLLFGTPEQQEQWLPDLISGRKIAAFALTEPEAGSDAANVQTTATLSDDGTHYVLNGEKRYITNGSIADVLTVMARMKVPGKDTYAISAFLVTPDMPGFSVTEARMAKLGIRGTATARLAFHNMPVPVGNVLGPIGKGLKVALTVLDFGRTTFGSCCTGAAKTCLDLSIKHARTRKQFGRTLAEFELVQQKLGRMAAWTYAMEAMTAVTAGIIDAGFEDYMLETAMLKVWSTERLWTIVNDAFQIHGGAAYFTDRPLERMLRDHRINQIGEGANEVLLSFIALTGMRGPGLKLKEVYDNLLKPKVVYGFFWEWLKAKFNRPDVPVGAGPRYLSRSATRLSKLIARFGRKVQRVLIINREEVVERQLIQERISWAAMELLAAACVLSRAQHEESTGMSINRPAVGWFLNDALNNAQRQIALMYDRGELVLEAAKHL